MKTKIVLRIVLVICIVFAGIFGGLLARELIIDRQSREFFSDLASDVERRIGNTGEPGTHGLKNPDGSENPDGSVDPDDIGGSGDTEAGWISYVDFDELNNDFPGIVGWIKLEGSIMDYPVMQYSDNDHFLTRLPDGTSHRNGSIFLDYRNERDFSDKSILIYGHETRTGDMFGVLKRYREQDFFDNNPVINLYTPYEDIIIEIFAVNLAHSQRDHPPLDFDDDDDFLDYIERLKRMSFIRSNIEVKPDDRIISLCTCAYDFNDARLVIVGILSEIN